MKTIYILYSIIILFLLTVTLLFLTEPPAFVTGQPHQEFSTMLRGGESLSLSGSTNLVGFLFGLCTVITLCTFVMLGVNRKDSFRKIRPWVLLSSILYCIAYICTYLSDVKYVRTGHVQFFLGWPLPTAWMVYVMWFTPVGFVLIYVLKFREWILPKEDEDRFYDLVKQRRNKDNNQ